VTETPDAPAPAPGANQRGIFGFRFALLYGALTAVLVVAIVGVVVVASRPGPPKPKPWSSWKPPTGNVTKMTQEIADHVAPRYKANAAGDQLVAILPGDPEVTRGTKVTKISAIGFLRSATATQFDRVVSTSGNVQDQFCGIGSQCSVGKGTPNAQRERLVRREALEVALYTFRYVPQVNAVIAYMPPPTGSQPSTLLYLERSNLGPELKAPLAKTLPVDPPPPAKAPDKKESAAIDRLTIPVEYSFQFQALNDGTEALVLTPTSS
jgi:hypothetical protein